MEIEYAHTKRDIHNRGRLVSMISQSECLEIAKTTGKAVPIWEFTTADYTAGLYAFPSGNISEVEKRWD